MTSRTAKTTLTRSFGQCRQPVILINHQRKVVYANSAAESLLGFEFEKLSSSKCNYHNQRTGDDLEDTLAAICPPPDAFAGKRISQPVRIPRPIETLFHASFLPLTADDSPTAVLVFVDREPILDEDGKSFVQQEILARDLLLKAQTLWSRECDLQNFVGQSVAAKQIMSKSEAAVVSGSNLVVYGPSGSGRQHLARAIHNARIDSQSNDASTASGSLSSDAEPNDDNAKLLIPLDARVADAELVQSTFASLFANHDSIQKTTWGRLLLLEADALDAASQNELSGLLRLRDFDVNISSTATRSLVGLAEKGKYDKTLASMLATIEIEIPPLQQRVEDIPVLAQLFLEQYNARGGRQLTGITPAAMDCLLQYSWPGNVDELSAMVVVAAEQTDGLQIDVDDLPKKIHLALAADAFPAVEQKSIDLDDYLKQIEMELIERALKQAKGNKTKAAELLQINRARLIRRLENQDNHEDVDFSESE